MKNIILKTYIQSFFFLIYVFAVFFICRAGFIVHTGILNSALNISEIQSMNIFREFINTCFASLRYDGRFAGSAVFIFMGIYFILSKTKKFRDIFLKIVTGLFTYIIVIASIVNDTYYNIFNDTFNVILLGTIYDDQNAIFQTAINSDYNVIPKILLSIIVTVLFMFIYIKIYQKIEKIDKNIPAPLLITSGVALIYLFLLVTSSTFNLQGGNLAYIVKLPENTFLKKSVPGALHDLDRVFRVHKMIVGGGIFKITLAERI